MKLAALFRRSPPAEIIDPPKPVSLRSQTLAFAAIRPDGFTDDEFYDHVGHDIARTTAISPRVKLVTEGLIYDTGDTRLNVRGNPVRVYKSSEFSGMAARPKPRRMKHADLVRKVRTLELELFVVTGQRDALINQQNQKEEEKA